MSFNNILGQGQAVSRLKSYLGASLSSSGYLFSGPEGVGKKLAALTLAKAANCEQNSLDACDACVSCRKIDVMQHPDVHLISGDGAEIKIELIRDLQRKIYLRPYEARAKFFILDNAHMMSEEASNALLKILEEPPKDSLIILISDKPGRLFKTVISRCKVVKFYSLPRELVQESLRKDFGMDASLAHLFAYFSEGRLGCALRIKDSGFLEERNKFVDGLLFQGDKALESLPIKTKEDFQRCLNILASWMRDAYLLKAGVEQKELINFDRRADVLKTAVAFSYLELEGAIDEISNSSFYAQRNINIKLLLHNLWSQLWKG